MQGWENTTFAVVYLLAAVGCGLVAAKRWTVVRWVFTVVSAFWLLFASLNYYTYLGLLTCTVEQVCLPW